MSNPNGIRGTRNGSPRSAPRPLFARPPGGHWHEMKQTSRLRYRASRRKRRLRLKRIAVRKRGHGTGSNFLRVCFDDLTAHRVELFVFEDNERAYVKNGFVVERRVRDLHRDIDGNFRSMCLMSRLRPESVARP